MTLGYQIGGGLELGLLGLVDVIVAIVADHGLVGGYLHHFHLVDLAELVGLGGRGTGHAGDLLVEPEVVLQGDGGECLVLFFDAHALASLDGLMQTLRVAPSFQDAPRELVDDLDLSILHQVVHVAPVEARGAQGLHEMVDQLAREVFVDVLDTEFLARPWPDPSR